MNLLDHVPSKYLEHVGDPIVEKYKMNNWVPDICDCDLTILLSQVEAAQMVSNISQDSELSFIHSLHLRRINFVFYAEWFQGYRGLRGNGTSKK